MDRMRRVSLETQGKPMDFLCELCGSHIAKAPQTPTELLSIFSESIRQLDAKETEEIFTALIACTVKALVEKHRSEKIAADNRNIELEERMTTLSDRIRTTADKIKARRSLEKLDRQAEEIRSKYGK